MNVHSMKDTMGDTLCFKRCFGVASHCTMSLSSTAQPTYDKWAEEGDDGDTGEPENDEEDANKLQVLAQWLVQDIQTDCDAQAKSATCHGVESECHLRLADYYKIRSSCVFLFPICFTGSYRALWSS